MINFILKYITISTILFIISYFAVLSNLVNVQMRIRKIKVKYPTYNFGYKTDIIKSILIFLIPVIRWAIFVILFMFVFVSDDKFDDYFLR